MYRHPTSPGSAASSTTLRGAPQAPDRPHEGEASPQEVGAGLRQERGPHWQRASPSGQRRPGPPWSAMPARHARHAGSAPRGGASARRGRGRARPGTRPAPAGCLGRRRARTGPRATRPLPQAVYGIQAAHGRRREGWEGEWAGGQGAPNDPPRPARRVGGGRGGGGRSRRPHGAGPQGAGPAPGAVRRTKGDGAPRPPRTRKLATRGGRVAAGARGANPSAVLRRPPQGQQRLQGRPRARAQRGGAVCGESRAHGAQRGLRHEVVSVMVVRDLVS